MSSCCTQGQCDFEAGPTRLAPKAGFASNRFEPAHLPRGE